MDFYALGIPIAFILIATIGLWLMIYSKGHWLFKMTYIAVCLYFGIATWASLSELSGWPSNSELPTKFMVSAVLVQDPMPAKKDQGAIYLWLIEIDQNNEAKKSDTFILLSPFVSKKREIEPRAYRLVYTEQRREQATQISRMLKAGKPVVGERKNLAGQGGKEGEKGENGNGQGNGNGLKGRNGQGRNGKNAGGGSLSQEQEFMFYELPPPLLPRK